MCRHTEHMLALKPGASEVSIVPFIRARRLKDELNDQFRCSNSAMLQLYHDFSFPEIGDLTMEQSKNVLFRFDVPEKNIPDGVSLGHPQIHPSLTLSKLRNLQKVRFQEWHS